ncbi:MAG: PQQ-binding-like beta-propeller repeat protein [Pirellulales bacterium]|nr:PQQ-binding-like beta-propeller repeat protein [Pirellulales bacterium]
MNTHSCLHAKAKHVFGGIKVALVASVLLTVMTCASSAAEESPYPHDSLAPLYKKAADFVLSQVEQPHKGHVLVFGAGEGRLAHELASRSEYTIIGAEEDENKIKAGRRTLDDADLYGRPVTLQRQSLDKLDYRDYAASLVVSDTIITDGTCPGSAAELFRIIRPHGGLAIVGQPPGCPKPLKRETLTKWLDTAGLKYKIIENPRDGLWAIVRRGPLEGAGEWTHVRADIANTACSRDTRTSGNFKVLWFGEPGPRIMVDRHWRNTSPLYKNGRLIIPAFDRIVCSDAYNGARLWDLEVPKASRIAMMRDAGWLALDDKYLYAAVGSRCLKINVVDGSVVDKFETPDDKSDWGYLAVDGDRLYGSQQIHEASYLASNTGRGAEGNQLGRGNERLIITSKSLFCKDAKNGELLWTYSPPDTVIANVTICVGPKGVHFIASKAPKVVADKKGRVSLADFTDGPNEFVVKLDKTTGKFLWQHQHEFPYRHVMHLCYANNIVLSSGCRSHEKDFWYHLRAYNAADGSVAWEKDIPTHFGTRDTDHGKQDKHPMIVGDMVYLKQGNFELATGKPLGFKFKTTNCAECSASNVNIFGRNGGVASTWSLAGDGSSKPLNPTMRPGCYTTIIPAGGIVMMPSFSAGCTCAHTIQTTIAWVPE